MTTDERREAARRLAGFRDRVEKVCAQCGKTYTGYPGQGVYCSARCRNRAWLERRKAQEEAPP